jgi:hypothetical protein
MGEARGMHGREKLFCGNLKERDHLDDLSVDLRIIVELFLKK